MNDAQRVLAITRLLIRTVSSKRVERVGHSNNSWQQRNFVSLEGMGIAASIKGLVMEFDPRDHFFQLRDRAQNVCALRGVRLHDFEFFSRESARLLQYAIFNSDFANV